MHASRNRISNSHTAQHDVLAVPMCLARMQRGRRGAGLFSFRNYLVHSSAFKLITRVCAPLQHNIFQEQTAGVYNHNKITPCAHTCDKAAATSCAAVGKLLSSARIKNFLYVGDAENACTTHTSKISLFLYNKQHLFIVCYCDVDARLTLIFLTCAREREKKICAEEGRVIKCRCCLSNDSK
jgi:hypothetical protein